MSNDSVYAIMSQDVIAHIQTILPDIEKWLKSLDSLEGEYTLWALAKADTELTALCNYLTKD